MRYFLIASITLHTALFAAWTTHDAPGYSNRPIAISLLTNNDIIPQQVIDQKHPAKHQEKNTRTNGMSHTVGTPSSIDNTISMNERADRQPGTSELTDASMNNHRDETDNMQQAEQIPPFSTPGTRVEAYLRRAFTPYFTYPKLAQEKGWQGTVELAVNIDAQGLLTKVRVIHSSGYGILDRAALNSIQQVRLPPNAAYWLDNHGLEVNFPVKYQLIDT